MLWRNNFLLLQKYVIVNGNIKPIWICMGVDFSRFGKIFFRHTIVWKMSIFIACSIQLCGYLFCNNIADKWLLFTCVKFMEVN